MTTETEENCLNHVMKDCFVDRVYGHVEDELIEKYLENYIEGAERMEGKYFWDNFSNVKEVIEDFKRFVEFGEEYM